MVFNKPVNKPQYASNKPDPNPQGIIEESLVPHGLAADDNLSNKPNKPNKPAPRPVTPMPLTDCHFDIINCMNNGINKWSVIRDTLTPKHGTLALDAAFKDLIERELCQYNKVTDKLIEVGLS